MRNLLILMILLFLSGCSKIADKEIFIYEKFPHEVSIGGQEIEVASVLYFVGDILLLDSIMVSLDMMADPFFQVFRLPSFFHIGGFIKHGKGPTEEIQIAPIINRQSENSFYYRSLNDVKILNFNSKTQELDIINRIDLPIELIEVMHLIILNGNIIGYNILSKNKSEYIHYNPISKKITKFGPGYPVTKMKVGGSENNLIFTKTIAGKPDGSSFAALYDKFPFLRIYSSSGELLRESRYLNNQKSPEVLHKKELRPNEMNDIMVNYLKIKTTEKLIYGLYAGKTHSELNTGNRGVDDFGKEIHVWDWDGKPIIKFILEQEIFSFSVSKDDDYMISSSVKCSDKLFKFNISPYLN